MEALALCFLEPGYDTDVGVFSCILSADGEAFDFTRGRGV
jgi:hypothetical protein